MGGSLPPPRATVQPLTFSPHSYSIVNGSVFGGVMMIAGGAIIVSKDWTVSILDF